MIQIKKGQRVELVKTNDPFTEMAPGTRGIVLADYDEADLTVEMGQVQVRWDNNSWLMLVPAAGDELKVVDHDAFCPTCGNEAKPVDYTVKNACGWWTCTDCDEMFEHRVRQLKVPTLVVCKAGADLPGGHGIKWDTEGVYTNFQGSVWCDDEDCRKAYKIA